MRLGLLFRTFHRFVGDRRGATSAVITLMIIPIVAAVGMGVEGGSWYLLHRAAQNAADAASVAAAINACAPGAACDTTAKSATYLEEAAAVAKEFGFPDDANTDVAATKVNCPGTTSPDCYQVLITKRFPLSLVRIVGFTGDATVSGQPAQTIRAVAIARPKADGKAFCMIGLQTSGEALRINGGPNVDLSGCDLYSNSNLVCNGANSDTGVNYGYAHGASQCGATKVSGSVTLADPFDALSSAIPAGTCTSAQIAAGTTINASTAWPGGILKTCGNTKLTGNITRTATNQVLRVHQGSLDLNGFTLKTTGTGSMTVILTGEDKNSGPNVEHILKGGGVIDIAAPLTGDLHGVAIMQDKTVDGSKNVFDTTYTGNDPTLNIQGLIYMPNGEFTVKGAINLHTGGLSCLGVVAKKILVSGTGAVFDNATSSCLDAGLYLPTIPGSGARQALVS
jgi:hypothetical protein